MSYAEDFVMLITRSEDNGILSECISDKIAFVHKISYTPVYEQFEGLKKFQLSLNHSSYVFRKNITVCVDISEWIGHENEEYFSVIMKYFHDIGSLVRYVFTVGKADEKSALPMFIKIRCFMSGSMKTDDTFINPDCLSDLIESKITNKKSAKILAQMLIKNESFRPLLSYPMINTICREITAISSGRFITLENTAAYLRSENSLPNLIDSKTSSEYAKLIDDIQKNSDSARLAC